MWNFIKSASGLSSWLEHESEEIAFFGRSNVGKSSLINAITKTKICKTSKTPGRTQLINFFGTKNGKIIVDLPGYGYAKISHEKKQKMLLMVQEYLEKRTNLKFIFLLIDSKIGPTKQDLEIINYLEKIAKKFYIVFTKIDKLNQSEKIKISRFAIRNRIENFFLVSIKNETTLEKLRQIF